MKRIILATILSLLLMTTPSEAFAQGMMGNWAGSSSGKVAGDHTAREEAEGKEIWEKLQAKKVACDSLSDADFQTLGEYFMGLSIGDTQKHAAMNQMMVNMMGEKGEEQMHLALGKRASGCDVNAQFPLRYDFMSMMGGWNGFGLLGWIPILLFWLLLVFGIVVLFRYHGSKTPLEILKERYAKGEIDKKEFEEKKKDMG